MLFLQDTIYAKLLVIKRRISSFTFNDQRNIMKYNYINDKMTKTTQTKYLEHTAAFVFFRYTITIFYFLTTSDLLFHDDSTCHVLTSFFSTDLCTLHSLQL